MASDAVSKPKKIAKAVVKPAIVPQAEVTKPVEKPLPVAAVEVVAAIPAAPVRETEIIAAEAVNKGTEKMNDTINETQETFQKAATEANEKATEVFNDMNARAKSAMEKAGSFAKDSVEFHKANLEAFVEAGKVAVKGSQTAAQNAADYGRKNFEATTAMVKQAAALRSPTELLKLQGEFARSQFDGAVAEMSRSTEFGLKLAGEIFQPIQNRYAVVAEEMKSRLAA